MKRVFHIIDHSDNRSWVIAPGGFAKPLLRMACSIHLNVDHKRLTLELGDLAIFSSDSICRRCFQRTYDKYGEIIFTNYGSGIFSIKERNLGRQKTVDLFYSFTKSAIYTNYGRVA